MNRGNTGSLRVLEKAGFEEEGLLREHEYADSERVDVDVYGILRSER